MNMGFRYQVAFLTGQSDPRRWALSAKQSGFMSALDLPDGVGVPVNFPYRPASPEYQDTSILQASANNAWMYLRSRTAAFRSRYKADIATLLDRADQTIFLAGSCGLELLLNMRLKSADLERVCVFAFGPVARAIPNCPSLLVQGRSDRLSRQFFPSVDYLVDCAHMDYLANPEVLSLCKNFIPKTPERE